MFYEHDYGYPQHEHLYCEKCHNVIEFQNPILDALIRDLDGKKFSVREKAMEELEKIGRAAVPALEKARDGDVSLEALTRITVLLDSIQGGDPGPANVRGMRAVALLEKIGGEDARKLLKKIAGGDDEANVTREAKAALQRLAR